MGGLLVAKRGDGGDLWHRCMIRAQRHAGGSASASWPIPFEPSPVPVCLPFNQYRKLDLDSPHAPCASVPGPGHIHRSLGVVPEGSTDRHLFQSRGVQWGRRGASTPADPIGPMEGDLNPKDLEVEAIGGGTRRPLQSCCIHLYTICVAESQMFHCFASWVPPNSFFLVPAGFAPPPRDPLGRLPGPTPPRLSLLSGLGFFGLRLLLPRESSAPGPRKAVQQRWPG